LTPKVEKPVPQPTPETEPYWEGTKAGELRMQRCDDCGRVYFYPRSFCRYCSSPNVTWQKLSGRGRLASYVINQRPTPPFDPATPIVIALIALDEGPVLTSTIVGVNPSPSGLVIGAPVAVEFESRGDQMLPVFRLSGGGRDDEHA
jgi:hypothetical protein